MIFHPATNSSRAPRAVPAVRLRRAALVALVLILAFFASSAAIHQHASAGPDDPSCAACTFAHQGALAPGYASADLVSPALLGRLAAASREPLTGSGPASHHPSRAPPILPSR